MDKLDKLGCLFILFGIFGIIANLYNGTTQYLIWFCNHSAIIIGLAVLKRSSYWIQTQVNLGLIPQVLWSADYLSKLFFDTYIFNLTEYMFTDYNPLLYILSLGHLFLVPIALYILYKLKQFPFTWKGNALHIAALIPISLTFTADYNLNCVYESCVPFLSTGSYYMYWWPAFVLAMAVFSNILVISIFNRK